MTEPKTGWFQRLTGGLARTSRALTEQVASTFTRQPLDQARLDALEEMLIEADLGPKSAARITEAFAATRFGKAVDEAE
ncbi:MAG: signal recognition particle receptor subunit alpha, partial [Phenylobacterium sp.]